MRNIILTLFLVIAWGFSAGWSQSTVCVLNPWVEDAERAELSIYIRSADGGNWYPGVEMNHTEGDWWCHTFSAHAPIGQSQHFIIVIGTSPNFNNAQWFMPGSGIVTTQPSQETWFSQSQIEQDYGQDATVYIFWDGAQVVITDSPPASKSIFILNPWTISAPTISVNGGEYEGMRLSDHCEWFFYHITGDSTYNLHFREIFGNSVYGAAGGSDAAPIDLNAHFATYDSAYIYPNPAPDGAPIISETYPNIEGTCGFYLAATVRDFCVGDDHEPTPDCPNPHPDFGNNILGGVVQNGMVDVNLGSDGKPTIGPAPYYQSAFDQWFNTVDGVNAETCVDIPMAKTSGGLWEYDSYHEPSKGYFPIDTFTVIGASERETSVYKQRNTASWLEDPTGTLHNFHFCLEMHANFVYSPGETPEKGQTLIIEGDDDVWVFIDDLLMVDLGGIHVPEADTLIIDNMAGFFGWSAGDTLSIDFFRCDRQVKTSSLRIQTSIYFEQRGGTWIDSVVIDENSTRYEIWRRTGAVGSCNSVSGDTTEPAQADYILTGTGIDGQRDLSSNPVVGITLGTESTNIAIDTAAIRTHGSLSPGNYILTVRTRNEPQREFRIPFTVYGDVGAIGADSENLLSFVGLSRSNGLRFRLEKPAVLGFEMYGVDGKRLWKYPRTAFKEGTHLLPLSESFPGEGVHFLLIEREGQITVKMLGFVE